MTNPHSNLFGVPEAAPAAGKPKSTDVSDIDTSASQPKPQPVQAPAGVADRGIADGSAVMTRLLVLRRERLTGVDAHELAQLTGLPLARVEAALDELRRRNVVSRETEGGVELWMCEVKPEHVTPQTTDQLTRGFYLNTIILAGEMGITLQDLAQTVGASIEDAEAWSTTLLKEARIWKPKGLRVYVASKFMGKGMWEVKT